MNTSPAITAIEQSGAEFLLALGRAGGGEDRHDATIHWNIGGSPIDYHNAVVAANLPPESIDTAIQDSIAAMRRHNVPGSWHVGPSMQPDTLGERLLANGFTSGGFDIGMAVELYTLPPTPPLPVGFSIQRV